MKEVGKVYALFISVSGEKTPVSKTSLKLDPKGILGDKHYESVPERTVLVTSLESYRLTENELGVTMPYGYLGENILIDFNPYALPIGTQLKIGTALLEITQNCTLCNHLSSLDKRIPKLLKNDRGIFAKVIREGEINERDTVLLV